MQLIVRRELNADAEYDRHAAFVLVPRDWQRPDNAIRRPLLHNGNYPLTGLIHFVNFVPNGHSLAYNGDEVDLFDALVTVQAQSFPTLIYSPKYKASTLSWFPRGTAENDDVEFWNIVGDRPSVDEIAEVIDNAYFKELITPDQTDKSLHVWADAKKGWAHENAEARVQHMVRLALIGAFRRCTIRGEQSGKDGRTDLEIVEDHAQHHVVHHAVLELKVLREKGATGGNYSDRKISEHMRDGLNQAHHYGARRNFRDLMLCCFDMRAINAGETEVMAPLAADAKTLGVHLRHWFLYRSSDHWRNCEVGKKLRRA